MLKALTANHLLTGQVVFFTELGGWGAEAHKARLAKDTEEATALEKLGAESVARQEVVGPELIDMELIDGKPWPSRNREQMRALGPSVREDLGYQAGQD